MCSSDLLHHTFDPVDGKAIADDFLSALGNPTAEELMEMPVEDLLEAQERVSEEQGQGTGRSQEPFYPVWGHDLLPGDPRDLVAEGRGCEVPLLTGTNEDELSLWGITTADADTATDVVARITDDPESLLAVYRRRLGDERSGEVEIGRASCRERV